MLDEFELSCGTPSRKVVIAGLAGLDPIPRNRGLLSFRAVNSVNVTLRRENARFAHDLDVGPIDRVLGNRRDADRQTTGVLWLLLRRDGHRRQGQPQLVVGRRRGRLGRRRLRGRARLSGSGRSRHQDGTGKKHKYQRVSSCSSSWGSKTLRQGFLFRGSPNLISNRAGLGRRSGPTTSPMGPFDETRRGLDRPGIPD